MNQLCALERRTARGGRDSIDHAPGGRDDVVNAAAGAVVMASGGARIVIVAPVIVTARAADAFGAPVHHGEPNYALGGEGNLLYADHRRFDYPGVW
jgi:hypothetical protein